MLLLDTILPGDSGILLSVFLEIQFFLCLTDDSPDLLIAYRCITSVEINATLAAGLSEKKCQRIVIIGAGPTGLGAAYRFSEHNDSIANNTEIIVVEMEQQAGGLASSYRDDKGFLWDNGGHVMFSHYDYIFQ